MPPTELTADELRRIKQEQNERKSGELAKEISLLPGARRITIGALKEKETEYNGPQKV